MNMISRDEDMSAEVGHQRGRKKEAAVPRPLDLQPGLEQGKRPWQDHHRQLPCHNYPGLPLSRSQCSVLCISGGALENISG